MARKLKNEVGCCKVCGSSAVLRHTRKGYADKKKSWSVVCANPDCSKMTPGYKDKNDALIWWGVLWQIPF